MLSRWLSGSDGKVSVYNAGDLGSIPGLGRSPGEGNGNPIQYSCLENPMVGGAWCPWGRKESDTTERLHFHYHPSQGFPGGTSSKEPTCQRKRHKTCRFDPWVGKIPWRRTWQPILVFLPGKSHGQRSLADYGPHGHQESDMTAAT